jgi:hypothetical protein
MVFELQGHKGEGVTRASSSLSLSFSSCQEGIENAIGHYGASQTNFSQQGFNAKKKLKM